MMQNNVEKDAHDAKKLGAAASLLVELRCEEFPPQLLFRLAHEFGADLCHGLQAAKLLDNEIDYAKVKQEFSVAYERRDFADKSIKRWRFVTYPTCRRLAVFVPNVRKQAPEIEQLRRGPAVSIAYSDGKPSKALLGFLRSNNASEKELIETEERSKAYVALISKTPASPLDALIGKVIEGAIKNTVAPKMMRWDGNDWKFVRPIRNICVVHGKRPVKASVFNMQAHGLTSGHRFLRPKEFDLAMNGGADGYVATMKKQKVMVDPWQRWAQIKRQVRKIEKASADHALKQKDGAAIKVQLPGFGDDDNVNMTEWPTASIVSLSGDDFDLNAIPYRVAKACVEKHLRGYCVMSGDEMRPLTQFVFVADNKFGSETRANKHVSGLEKVFRARLDDAKYLYENDKEQGPEDLRRYLEGIHYLTYFSGNMSKKNKRLVFLAGEFACMLAQGDEAVKKLAMDAAYWCLIDLASGTLGEYPQLAGYVASSILRDCGESYEAVWDLLANWKDETIEKGNPALHSLVLADELERLVIFAAADRFPSGSSDPHGLRLSATRVLSVLADYDNCNLSEFIKLVGDKVYEAFDTKGITENKETSTNNVHFVVSITGSPEKREEAMNKLVEFILARLAHVMRASGDDGLDAVTPRLCQAVTSGLKYGDNIDVHAVFERVAALALLEKKHHAEFQRAMALHKRLYNITVKGFTNDKIDVNESKFELPAEIKLFDAIKKMEIGSERKQIVYTFEKKFLNLIPFVEEFFDKVRVDVDDLELARNRLALVDMARDKFDSVADFRRLYS